MENQKDALPVNTSDDNNIDNNCTENRAHNTKENRRNDALHDNDANTKNGVDSNNPTLLALQELIDTEAKLKQAIEKKQEEKRRWRIQDAALRNSNWKLQIELNNLRKETDNLEKEVFAKTEVKQKALDDLERYKLRNKQEVADFWAYFQEETQKYSNLFTNAHIDYSSDCLNQDIEHYQRECQIILRDIEKIDKDTEDLKIQFGLIELGTNKEANLLVDIENFKKILLDKKPLQEAIKMAENNIEILKLKVKQKQDEINYFKKKSRKN